MIRARRGALVVTGGSLMVLTLTACTDPVDDTYCDLVSEDTVSHVAAGARSDTTRLRQGFYTPLTDQDLESAPQDGFLGVMAILYVDDDAAEEGGAEEGVVLFATGENHPYPVAGIGEEANRLFRWDDLITSAEMDAWVDGLEETRAASLAEGCLVVF
jgi:hypothetical protein